MACCVEASGDINEKSENDLGDPSHHRRKWTVDKIAHQKTGCASKDAEGPEGTCADRQTEDEWGESKAGKGRRTSLLGQTLKYVFY